MSSRRHTRAIRATFESRREVENDDGVIEHDFVAVTHDGKIDTLVELLGSEDGLSLVFVRTKRGADRLAQKLARRGVDVVAMHGDMGQSQRERALERFRSGRATTLIATDVAARGLDLEAIGHVINFDPPEDDKGYVHRVGRTGRAGRSGRGCDARPAGSAGRRESRCCSPRAQRTI